MNLNVILGQQAGLGMPSIERVRVSAPSSLPMMTAAAAQVSGQKCALIASTPVTGYRHIVTDVVVKGAFPGTSAWSPPI
jgi:hypothetical protein